MPGIGAEDKSNMAIWMLLDYHASRIQQVVMSKESKVYERDCHYPPPMPFLPTRALKFRVIQGQKAGSWAASLEAEKENVCRKSKGRNPRRI